MNDICHHGKRVWGNYGDGKIRHFDNNDRPTMEICDDPKVLRSENED